MRPARSRAPDCRPRRFEDLVEPSDAKGLAACIREHALARAIGEASVAEIDATEHPSVRPCLRWPRAVRGCRVRRTKCFVDGLRLPCRFPVAFGRYPGRCLGAVDQRASILAKTVRDATMVGLHARHPGYGFDRHKGYPTAEHVEALRRLGPVALTAAASRRCAQPSRRSPGSRIATMDIARWLHVLGVTVWVGGMFFAYMALRPAAAQVLDPPQRLPLWSETLGRFFRWVWVAVALILASGVHMMVTLGGLPGAALHLGDAADRHRHDADLRARVLRGVSAARAGGRAGDWKSRRRRTRARSGRLVGVESGPGADRRSPSRRPARSSKQCRPQTREDAKGREGGSRSSLQLLQCASR